MEKEEIVEAGKTELYEDDLLYGIKAPRSSCKYCNGSGRVGWRTNGEAVLCRCMHRSGAGEWVTAKKFKEICTKIGEVNEGSDNNTGTDEVHTSESGESETT